MSYLKELEDDLISRCTTAYPAAVTERYGGEFFSDESVYELKQKVAGRSGTAHLLVKLQSLSGQPDDSTYMLEKEAIVFEIGVAAANRRRTEDSADEIYDILDALRKNVRNVNIPALTDGVVQQVFVPRFDLAHSEPGLSVYRVEVVYTLKRDLEV